VNLKAIIETPSIRGRIEELTQKGSFSIDNIPLGAKAPLIAAIYSASKKPILFISEDSQSITEDIKAYCNCNMPVYFPSWDTFPTEDISPSKEVIGERLALLDRLNKKEPLVVCCKIKTAITRCIPEQVLKDNTIKLKVKGTFSVEEISIKLCVLGYKRRDIVGEHGEFAVRGGIVDIFPTNLGAPIRLELIGNDIESIRMFDAGDQRSKAYLNDANILPVHEIILEDPSLYRDGVEIDIPAKYPEYSGITDHLPDNALIIMDNPSILDIASQRYIKELEDLKSNENGKYHITFNELVARISKKQVIEIGQTSHAAPIEIAHTDEYHGNLEDLADKMNSIKSDHAVNIISGQAERIYEFLQEKGLSPIKTESASLKPGIYIMHGNMTEGFSAKNIRVLTDKEIFGVKQTNIRFKAKPKEGISKDILTDLKVNDIVVHENYGIGIYRGLKELEIGGAIQEYILIEYADNDALYVPLHQMGLVDKYSAGSEHIPKLNRLGGTEWIKTRSKAKKAVKDITKDLIEIYSERNRQKGMMYPPDNMWQVEFEKAFPYEETPDQEKAIRQIKKEMESGRLIDRLVCGDVGYGKTEVAIRAAFKTASAGKQVALLAPTTVLADQHFRTFSERFKPYPMSIELLSRFRSKEEQKTVIKGLNEGSADIVVGTHRLLSKDVKFKDLGLIIVDEEQKFGVTHKERLKTLSNGVNIITLSATPIPRTLYMSLSGIREMSLISTPPLDRSPVRTYLKEWNENTIKEVIMRELERGGQVFFVHNQVKTIDKIAYLISTLVPEAKVAIGHGQMKEEELENVMVNFINGRTDILVSTSIIESGLDIPRVNTVIIDHAENFGLSQLYQIRGRVGRSSTRAFAYLMYHKGNVLTDTAMERLKAIQEFSALGSGYKLAMADLEIRGAGNLLGSQQSGHILNIGFDMYCELLEESVREIKGIEIPPSRNIYIDVKIDAYIPQNYVQDEKQRIALYRRMNFMNTTEEIENMRTELLDRFGKVPKQVTDLLSVIKLKIAAEGKGILSITGGRDTVFIKLSNGKVIKIPAKGLNMDKWLKLISDTVSTLPDRK
jgi:transcription-repair coupling factor (superfamily II helicase)